MHSRVVFRQRLRVEISSDKIERQPYRNIDCGNKLCGKHIENVILKFLLSYSKMARCNWICKIYGKQEVDILWNKQSTRRVGLFFFSFFFLRQRAKRKIQLARANKRAAYTRMDGEHCALCNCIIILTQTSAPRETCEQKEARRARIYRRGARTTVASACACTWALLFALNERKVFLSSDVSTLRYERKSSALVEQFMRIPPTSRGWKARAVNANYIDRACTITRYKMRYITRSGNTLIFPWIFIHFIWKWSAFVSRKKHSRKS